MTIARELLRGGLLVLIAVILVIVLISFIDPSTGPAPENPQ